MKRGVPVAVCHVDYKLQQLRGDGGEGVHVGLDNGRVRSFVTGHTQPLLQHGGVGRPLRSDRMRTLRGVPTLDRLSGTRRLCMKIKKPEEGLSQTEPQKKQRKYVACSSGICKNVDIKKRKLGLVLHFHHSIAFFMLIGLQKHS